MLQTPLPSASVAWKSRCRESPTMKMPPGDTRHSASVLHSGTAGQEGEGVHAHAREAVRELTGAVHLVEVEVLLQGSVVNNRCGVPSRVGAHLPLSVLAQQDRAAWRGATLAAARGCTGVREDGVARGGDEGVGAAAGGGEGRIAGGAEGVEAVGDRVGDTPGEEVAALTFGLAVTGCGRALTVRLRSGVGGIADTLPPTRAEAFGRTLAVALSAPALGPCEGDIASGASSKLWLLPLSDCIWIPPLAHAITATASTTVTVTLAANDPGWGPSDDIGIVGIRTHGYTENEQTEHGNREHVTSRH